jgi:polysaccharide biosynthesis transport protein
MDAHTANEVVPAQADEDTIDLQPYIQVLRRRKGAIFGLTLLFALVAGLIALSMTPVYESTATLMIQAKNANVVSIQEVYGIDSIGKEYYQTQFEVLKSRQLTERVINKLKLDRNPEFLPKEPSKNSWNFDWRSWMPDWRAWIPNDLFPNLAPKIAQDDPEVRANAIWQQFSGRLTISPIRNSQLVNISFAAYDRKLAAEVANAIAAGYIESEMEARLEMTSTATRWLTERLKGLRGKLEQSELALQTFREKEHLLDVSGVKTLSAEQLSDINQKLVLAQQRMTEARTAYEQIKTARSGAGDAGIDSIPAVLHDTLVGTLKEAEATARRNVSSLAQRYGAKHPKLVAAEADLATADGRVNKRIREVLSGVEKEYRAASANLASLQSAMGETKGEMQQINRKGYQLSVLQREVDTNRHLYELFLGRLKETSETSGLQSTNARVVDQAVPAVVPAKPKKQLITLIAALTGMLFGIFWAFLLERLDRTIKGSGDLEERLQLPVLGSLPHLTLRKAKGEQTPWEHVRRHPQGLFAESLRTVRTGVLLSGLDRPHKIILVTSSVPQEGKSSVSSSLAETLATLHKVLLIDGDLRRPTARGIFGIDKGHKGLSDFVSGSAKLEDCLVEIERPQQPDHADEKDADFVGQSDYRGLFVLPSCTIPPNPLELLSSKRLAETIQRLSATFDHIIIDCAPVLAVSDALLLSTLASGVIYVVRADMTPWPLAQEGLKRLRGANAHLIGGVLNQVPFGKKGGYYGKYGYGKYGYGRYGYSKYGYYGDQYHGSYGYTS